jgi:heme-degrading monooxygenase HmoA
MTVPATVVRIWRALAEPANVSRYLEHFEREVTPQLNRSVGFVSGRILQRELPTGVELLVVTFWESLDVVKAFAGEDLEAAVVHPAARAVLLEADDRAANYRVVRTRAP